jgi:hypothetical protein
VFSPPRYRAALRIGVVEQRRQALRGRTGFRNASESIDQHRHAPSYPNIDERTDAQSLTRARPHGCLLCLSSRPSWYVSRVIADRNLLAAGLAQTPADVAARLSLPTA